MKYIMLLMFLSVAYAQSPDPGKTSPKSDAQKQEEPATQSIENPFDYGPYKGDEYVPFDRLRKEKAESKEQREEEEENQSQI